MQQSVVVQSVDVRRKMPGRLVEQKQTGVGKYRGVLKIYHGGPPVADRRVKPEVQRRV